MKTTDFARLIHRLIDRAAPSHDMWNPAISDDGERVTVTLHNGGKPVRVTVLVESVRPL